MDKVHDMMDDIAEQQELSNEISNAISNPVGFGEDLDDDELAKELEELEQQDLDEKILDVPNPLPSVPDTPVAVKPKPTSKCLIYFCFNIIVLFIDHILLQINKSFFDIENWFRWLKNRGTAMSNLFAH